MLIKVTHYEEDNAVVLHTFKAQEVLMMTTDTFGGMREMGDRWTQYHGCKKEDRGTCFVVETRNCIAHVFPKDAEARIMAE